jgi:hypothetical protein
MQRALTYASTANSSQCWGDRFIYVTVNDAECAVSARIESGACSPIIGFASGQSSAPLDTYICRQSKGVRGQIDFELDVIQI